MQGDVLVRFALKAQILEHHLLVIHKQNCYAQSSYIVREQPAKKSKHKHIILKRSTIKADLTSQREHAYAGLAIPNKIPPQTLHAVATLAVLRTK